MKKEVDVVKVKIFGCEYAIRKKGEEDLYYEKIAGLVDEKMRAISEKSSLVSIDRIAVLAALRVGEELLKVKKVSEDREKVVLQKLKGMTETVKSSLK